MSKVQPINEKKEKEQYKIINWKEYNRNLVKRGDITVWVEEEMIREWYYEGPSQRGAQYVYSDKSIECLLGLKVVFKLAYRQTEGFARSIFKLMGYDAIVPSYSQINRRAVGLEVDLQVSKSKGPLHIVMDSTGLKVYGEGEWKVRKHGYSKRRTWRKLHLAVDEKTGYVYAQVLTENDIDDASQLEPMLEQISSEVDKVGADGAYDTEKCWDYLEEEGIEGLIPPREGAVYWTDQADNILDYGRNRVLERIDEVGKAGWKKESGYHRRSLSETAMFRFKTIHGPTLFSRTISRQKTEAGIKVKTLNKMTATGMPVSVRVA